MCGYLQTLPSLSVKVDHSGVQSLASRLLENHAEPSAYGCLKTGQPHGAPFEWGPRMVSCLARFDGWAEGELPEDFARRRFSFAQVS